MKKYIFSLCLAVPASAAAGQTLHNGIILPEVWPPRYSEPTERKEMPVPYLGIDRFSVEHAE